MESSGFGRSMGLSLGVSTTLVVAIVSLLLPEPSRLMAGQEIGQKEKGESSGKHTFLPGNRTITGTVLGIRGNEIEVDVPGIQPRFLSLEQAKEKGMKEIKEGDTLDITLNDQSAVVDFHPAGSAKGEHQVIRGKLAGPLRVGHDMAVIRTADGVEKSFAINPAIRSKVASIAVGVDAIFLIDETHHIADATFGSEEALQLAEQAFRKKSEIKGVHRQVAGTFVAKREDGHISIKSMDGEDMHLEIRPFAKDRLESVTAGQSVILLVDRDNKIVDIALPPDSAGSLNAQGKK